MSRPMGVPVRQVTADVVGPEEGNLSLLPILRLNHHLPGQRKTPDAVAVTSGQAETVQRLEFNLEVRKHEHVVIHMAIG